MSEREAQIVVDVPRCDACTHPLRVHHLGKCRVTGCDCAERLGVPHVDR